ncbi:unnamed protein product [marine sediment metagenome]|uniref:Uncharacterized protein n=1 Tax=marine sediment metagenome TaxID=412755 RepID=X1I4U5_9ZZZZ
MRNEKYGKTKQLPKMFEAKTAKNKKADHGSIQKKPESLQEQETKSKDIPNKSGW